MFDYILLADITNDTDASVRLAAGWKMSPSIKPSWQLPLSVNSCQRRALLSKRLANRKGENKREKKRKRERERGERERAASGQMNKQYLKKHLSNFGIEPSVTPFSSHNNGVHRVLCRQHMSLTR